MIYMIWLAMVVWLMFSTSFTRSFQERKNHFDTNTNQALLDDRPSWTPGWQLTAAAATKGFDQQWG